MDFHECKDKLEVVKKLHVSNEGKNKTIWYKPKTAKSIRIATYDKDMFFDLNDVSLLSLSNEGILVQSETGGVKSLNPFPLNRIKKLEVE